jgi:hypothetical protein
MFNEPQECGQNSDVINIGRHRDMTPQWPLVYTRSAELLKLGTETLV